MPPALRAAIVAIFIAGAVVYGLAATQSRPAFVEAGFWFDEVTFDSARLGGPLTREEVAAIESVARAELREAFRGLPLTVSDRHDARYTIRVVQDVRDLRFKRPVGVAGQSRGIRGFGGSGAVSFDFLANGAMSYAPDDADRTALVAAIGRGVGRTAVHELTHQILPTAPIHDSRDERSYEFRSASRRAQYFGTMRWNLARPLLQQRLGGVEGVS
jgi:hypothetical protein